MADPVSRQLSSWVRMFSKRQVEHMGTQEAEATLVASFRYKCLVHLHARVHEVAERAAAGLIDEVELCALEKCAEDDAGSSNPITEEEFASLDDELAQNEQFEEGEDVDGEQMSACDE